MSVLVCHVPNFVHDHILTHNEPLPTLKVHHCLTSIYYHTIYNLFDGIAFAMAHVDQVGIPCAYIRGGTSKAMFFHEKDLPPPGATRDSVFKRLMGTPDSHQIDGMGGATTHTSKIAIISAPSREDADVDFNFVHVFIERDAVSYTGNCGNISSAVGPFAIDEGIVKVNRKGISTDPNLTTREVRIHSLNTKSILVAHVTVDPSTGFSVTSGKASISGVPGTSAPVLMDYSNVSIPYMRRANENNVPRLLFVEHGRCSW